MDCKQISEILDDHRLASLSSAERARFDEHLADCESCSEVVAIAHRLAAEVSPAPSAGLFGRVTASIGNSRRQARRPSPGPRWQTAAGLAAALVLAIGLGYAFLGPASESVNSGTGSVSAESNPPDTLLPIAARYTEGEQFSRIPGAARLSAVGDRISAWVFFMWSCRHCYEFEAILKEWVWRQSGKKVDVIRVPVQWNALGALHARAFYAAETLGIGDTVGPVFFEEIHQNGRLLDTVSEIETVFADAGVDRESFAAAFESEEVEQRLATVRRIAGAFQVDSVPAIVVDGVYKTTAATAGSFEEMVQVADELIAVQARVALQDQAGEPVETETSAAGCATESPALAAIDDAIDRTEQLLRRLLRTNNDRHPDVVASRQKLDSLQFQRVETLAVLINDCAANA